jgi:hypothetical protein
VHGNAKVVGEEAVEVGEFGLEVTVDWVTIEVDSDDDHEVVGCILIKAASGIIGIA